MARGLQPGWGFSSFPPPDMLIVTLPQNAYYTELGLDPSPLQAVDLMHNVELGLERLTILHLFRIFHAEAKDIIQKFDARSVPLHTAARSHLDHQQLSPSSNIWTRHYPEVWRKCFCTEAASCENF